MQLIYCTFCFFPWNYFWGLGLWVSRASCWLVACPLLSGILLLLWLTTVSYHCSRTPRNRCYIVTSRWQLASSDCYGISSLVEGMLFGVSGFLLLLLIIINGHSLRRACLQPAFTVILLWYTHIRYTLYTYINISCIFLLVYIPYTWFSWFMAFPVIWCQK